MQGCRWAWLCWPGKKYYVGARSRSGYIDGALVAACWEETRRVGGAEGGDHPKSVGEVPEKHSRAGSSTEGGRRWSRTKRR